MDTVSANRQLYNASSFNSEFSNNCYDKLNFRQYIYEIYRTCYYHIRDLWHIRRYLPLSITKTIGTALVTCRLDNCSSLFHNISIKDITKLQCVKNCLARVLTRCPCFTHSKPFLKCLHWLPVRYRSIFKIYAITYQAPSCAQPSYLHSLITPARKPDQTRSSSSDLLLVI